MTKTPNKITKTKLNTLKHLNGKYKTKNKLNINKNI